MSFIESVRRHPKVVAGVFSLLTIGSSGCDKSQPALTTQLAAAAGTSTPEAGAKQPLGTATVAPSASATAVPRATETPIPLYTPTVDKECANGRLLVIGARFIKNPAIVDNNGNYAGPKDLAVGDATTMGEVAVVRRNDPTNPSAGGKLIGTPPLLDQGNGYSQVVVDLSNVAPNTVDSGVNAVGVEYFFLADKKEVDVQTGELRQPRYSTTVKCGSIKPVMGGRSADINVVKKAVAQADYQFKTMGSIMEDAMRKTFKRSAGYPIDNDFAANRVAATRYVECIDSKIPLNKCVVTK